MQSVNKFIGHFINGQQYVDNGTKIDLLNPCNGKLIGIISSATDKTIDKAINCSEIAFEKWRKIPISKRTGVLFKYKDLLETLENRNVCIQQKLTYIEDYDLLNRSMSINIQNGGLMDDWEFNFK